MSTLNAQQDIAITTNFREHNMILVRPIGGK